MFNLPTLPNDWREGAAADPEIFAAGIRKRGAGADERNLPGISGRH